MKIPNWLEYAISVADKTRTLSRKEMAEVASILEDWDEEEPAHAWWMAIRIRFGEGE